MDTTTTWSATSRHDAISSPTDGSRWSSASDLAPDLEDGTDGVPKPAWSPVALEGEILAVFLPQPEDDGEPRDLVCKRKEHRLAALFAELVPAESLELEERLRRVAPDDPIAAQFHRFVAARRLRLLTFLADSRKRHPRQVARARGDGG